MRRILAIILCLVVLAAVFPLPFTARSAEDNGTGMLDEIIIKFYDRSQFPGKEKQYDDEVAKILKDGLSSVCRNVFVVKAEGLSKNPNALLNKYKNSKFIEYVEPNYTGEFDLIPNDANYRAMSATLTVIGAQAGWDIITGGGPPVAIVDSGVFQHTDLPRLLGGYSAVASLSPNNDKAGHGTGVAGTVGALGNNGIGGVGINWNASIMPVKVDDANGALTVANIAKGVMWAADNGARIINLSLGTTADSATLKNAIDYAYNKGCAIFAATGNSGTGSISFPARYSNVMAVGATGNGTTRAAISNYGSGMGVVAVTSYTTTTATGGYLSMSGTSFSSPQVVGLASLILALNPSLKNTEVYSYIQQGAKPLGGGYNEQTGYGVIDIGKTLQLVKDKTSPPKKDTTPPVLKLNGALSMEIRQGTTFVDPGYTATDDTDGNITNKVTVTGTVNVNVPGVYRLEYKVSDAAGNTASATRVVEVILVDDEPPVLTLVGGASMTVKQGEAFKEPGYTAVDNIDGDITGKVVVTGSVNTNTPGNYTLTYSVADTAGNQATATRVVQVVAPPVIPESEPEPEPEPEIANEGDSDNNKGAKKSFLIEAAKGTRNNYNGSVGYEFECLEDMAVSTVGRPLNGTMKNAHKVYLWEVKTMKLLATAEVKPDSPEDAQGFKTAELNQTITLKAGERYRIASAETAGGDSWHDVSSTYNLLPTADCRITNAVFTNEGQHSLYPQNAHSPAMAGKGYTGVTFYYKTGADDTPGPVTPTNPVYSSPPVITLKGSLETGLFVDDEYIEAGYKAEDCYGVDITSSVRVTNNINMRAPGYYTVEYEAKDAGGNSARAARTVKVTERKEPPRSPAAPVLTIIGSDPIVLHVGSNTAYKEQGALAVDEADGDISRQVQLSGNVDRNKAGTYTVTYKVTNSAGLQATATRTVRILAASETKLPRQTYNFSGQGKAVSTVTHKNVVADNAGFMDFGVTSLDKGMTIKVDVKDQKNGATVFTNTYTGTGSTQFRAEKGTYDVNVTIAAGNGNSKYGVRLETPETITYTFKEPEVPLSSPELIKSLIAEGNTPLELCLKFIWPPESLNPYYADFIAAGWSDEDLQWFGLSITEDATPLASGTSKTGGSQIWMTVGCLIGATVAGLIAVPAVRKKRERKEPKE